MKLALLSLAAVVSAVAPRERPPQNTNPVQTPGATTPTNSLTILPIVSFTPFPDSTSTDKITIPIISSNPTHTTHTFPPTSETSPVPTCTSSTPGGSSSSSSHHSTSSGTTTHNSTTSSAPSTGTRTGTGTSGSSSSSRASSSSTSSPSTAAAAVATANMMAGIAAIAGLIMVA